MTTATPLVLSQCEACQTRFLPSDTPCPKCGSTRITPFPVPARGRAIAATELSTPAPGWSAPHRLALVEVADGVRVLAVVDGELPAAGAAVEVQLTGSIYRTHAGEHGSSERGEGESPRARRRGPSFEPPR